MRKDYLLDSPIAMELYKRVKDLPICDYHCHLSPKEIYQDKEFTSIGEMWLGSDHYKWRLMRQAGVDEAYITGSAPWADKFQKYAQVVSTAGGNPLFAWSHMELSRYFAIETPLNADTAADIFAQAGAYIVKNQLSPRKLIAQSGVQYIATTDDPADDLAYHKLLQQDKGFATMVAPTFRTDKLMSIEAPTYPDYIKILGDAAGVIIDDIGDLRIALRLRLDEFCACNCRFSDLGIEGFPPALATREEAAPIFARALRGTCPSKQEQAIFVGYMYRFLSSEYKRRHMTMQLHLAVKRDANTRLTLERGRDTGSDCVGDPVKGSHIMAVLSALYAQNRLPKTVIYTLNPQMNSQLAPICGSFPKVVQGAAWWYCDHKRGIADVLESIAETGYLGSFLGMLTDSRSFLSYARHDYFRRILCSLLAKWCAQEDFSQKSAQKLAADLCYNNIKAYCTPTEIL